MSAMLPYPLALEASYSPPGFGPLRGCPSQWAGGSMPSGPSQVVRLANGLERVGQQSKAAMLQVRRDCGAWGAAAQGCRGHLVCRRAPNGMVPLCAVDAPPARPSLLQALASGPVLASVGVGPAFLAYRGGLFSPTAECAPATASGAPLLANTTCERLPGPAWSWLAFALAAWSCLSWLCPPPVLPADVLVTGYSLLGPAPHFTLTPLWGDAWGEQVRGKPACSQRPPGRPAGQQVLYTSRADFSLP